MPRNEGEAELKKWMGQSRGAWLTKVKKLIESDSIAMRRVGIFLSEAGIRLQDANMYALMLAYKIGKLKESGCVKVLNNGHIDEN